MHNSDFGGFFTNDNVNTNNQNFMKFYHHVIKFDLSYVYAKNHCIWLFLRVKLPPFIKKKIIFVILKNIILS